MRRVVITGIGIVSPIGNSAAEVEASLRAGKSGIVFAPEYAERGFRSQVHGQPNIVLEDHIDKRDLRFMGDGAAYNGNQPRLIVRRNDAIGITSDTVLATYSAGTGSWNQLSGTTAAFSDDGVAEVIVDCDGTAGWTNIDDWSVS